MRIKRLTISGYRCFAEPFVLDDLGPVVALYGENNSGKSTVLSALRLLGRLMAQNLLQLLLEEPQKAEAAYQRLGEDEWMFTLGEPRRVSVEAHWESPDRTVCFEVSDDGRGDIVISLSRWGELDDVDLSVLREHLRWIREVSERPDEQELARRREALMTAEQRWALAQATSVLVATVGPAYVPTPRNTLQSIADARRSLDIAVRSRAKALFVQLGSMARGLPPGEFELGGVDGAPDVSFVEARGVLPLHKLGAGTQALVTLLAEMYLTQCSVMCLEEPETHQNPLQQNNVVALLERFARSGEAPQFFVATHSLTLASASIDLRVLKREGVRVTVRTAERKEVQMEFGAHLSIEEPPRRATRFVGEDGAVLLPQTLREELGIRSGELVFFVRRERVQGAPIWELMSERAIDDALGEGRTE
jgi:energy-coupling factor transporter ATP-binding protein EcfA2